MCYRNLGRRQGLLRMDRGETSFGGRVGKSSPRSGRTALPVGRKVGSHQIELQRAGLPERDRSWADRH